ncbi:Putative multidrug resistance protein MdtD [Streptomyces glaucescens]
MAAPTAAPADLAPPSGRSRWVALGVIATGMLMIVLDGSIVTVAMPAIEDHLGFTPAGLSWVVNAYLIAFGSPPLLAGLGGDLLGRKRMFLTGTAVFTAASVLAAAATSPAVLITARFAQGIGSAMAAAVSLGILVTLFTEPRERAKAIAVFSFTGAAGASIGQVLGGVLTDALNWHWIFFINLPIGLAALALAVPVLPADRGLGLSAGADVIGALLVTAGLMLGIYTVVKVEENGWSSYRTLGLGALAIALLIAFAARQATAHTPHAVAHLPLAQCRRRQPRPDPHGRRPVLLPDPGRPVPAAGARLRCRQDRPCDAPGGRGDRRGLPRRVHPPQRPVR